MWSVVYKACLYKLVAYLHWLSRIIVYKKFQWSWNFCRHSFYMIWEAECLPQGFWGYLRCRYSPILPSVFPKPPHSITQGCCLLAVLLLLLSPDACDYLIFFIPTYDFQTQSEIYRGTLAGHWRQRSRIAWKPSDVNIRQLILNSFFLWAMCYGIFCPVVCPTLSCSALSCLILSFPFQSGWLILQRTQMEKRGPSYIVGGNVNWSSHCRKQYGGVSKN